jgi:hypothetical protein
MQMNSLIDVRAVLPAIRVPTLVVNRGTDFDVRVEEGRYIAERVPGARFVELPGADHFVGIDPDQILDVVEPFLRGCGTARPAAGDDRGLITLVAMESPAPPAALDRHREVLRGELDRYRGRELEGARDRIVACFDGPARAVRFAAAITDAARALGIETRAAVHTGDVEIAEGRARGEALDVAVGAAGAARRGDVLVSRTVKDLVGGSGLAFAERASSAPAAIAGEWHRLDVVGSRPDMPAPSGAPLVGRAGEIEVLERALRRTRSGSGSTVLIAGESGIGKTRLVTEVVARARTAGFDALVGRCLDLVGTELRYQPFVEALRALAPELPFVDGYAAPS